MIDDRPLALGATGVDSSRMPTAPRPVGHTIIVGGGVVGLSVAYYCLSRGLAVTVLERGRGDYDCCSLGNAGMIVPSHFVPLAAPGIVARGLRALLDRESPFFILPRLDANLLRWGWRFQRSATARHVEATRGVLRDLLLESRRLFEELARAGDVALEQRGLLALCRSEEGLAHEAALAEQARELGIAAEVLDARATAAREPALTMDVAGAVYFAQDCHLDPAQLHRALRARVLAMGGTIEQGVAVERLEASRGAVTAVVGGGRRIDGARFVVAAGAWSHHLLSTVGVRLLLEAGKGYSLTVPSPPQLPRLCAILTEASVAVTPMGGALRFAGTMELAGLDSSINPARVRGIVKAVQAYLPRFGAEQFADVVPWAGLRPVSADGLPYVGRVDGLSNLVVATGHAMLGVSLGPVTGQIVADLLTDARPFREISQLGVGRF
jgi:D-amino-acid dehydrogenase